MRTYVYVYVYAQDGGIDDPTLDVTDPAWVEDEEDLALDLKRRPRPEAMASWVAAAQGVDPFKVRGAGGTGRVEIIGLVIAATCVA